MLMKFENLARSESFLPDFLHNEDKYSLKFRFLSICKTSNFCLLISQIISSPIWAQNFHAYNKIQTGGIYLDLISYYYSETIQLLVSYYVPVFISRSLDLCHGQKMWYQLLKLQTSVDSVR